jgi:hypothetical protein
MSSRSFVLNIAQLQFLAADSAFFAMVDIFKIIFIRRPKLKTFCDENSVLCGNYIFFVPLAYHDVTILI